MFCVVVAYGVTQLHDVVYIVCSWSPRIVRFNTTTHERLPDIHVEDMEVPQDIVACEQTSQLYVADNLQYVWRVSADGDDIYVQLWWTWSSTDTFAPPATLSVTSTRLLVTSSKQLMQLDSLGNELRHVQLPDDMYTEHAVESPTATFIVTHINTQVKPHRGQISEVNTDGQVLRQFTGSRLSSLGFTPHVAIDSHGNILVADFRKGRILLLDAQLKLRRLIIDEHQLNYEPGVRTCRLCYREQTGQLLVGLGHRVTVFDVLCR